MLEWVESGSGSRRCVTAVDAAQGLSARQVRRVRVIRVVADGQSLAIRHACFVRTFSRETPSDVETIEKHRVTYRHIRAELPLPNDCQKREAGIRGDDRPQRQPERGQPRIENAPILHAVR